MTIENLKSQYKAALYEFKKVNDAAVKLEQIRYRLFLSGIELPVDKTVLITSLVLSGYKTTYTWEEKVLYVLGVTGMKMKSSQILIFLCETDSSVKASKKASLKNIIDSLVVGGKIKRVKDGNEDFKYYV